MTQGQPVVWWRLSTDLDAMLFDPQARHLFAKLGTRVVTLHEHGDGTGCILIAGPLTRGLREDFGDDMTLASVDDLDEAGVTDCDWLPPRQPLSGAEVQAAQEIAWRVECAAARDRLVRGGIDGQTA